MLEQVRDRIAESHEQIARVYHFAPGMTEPVLLEVTTGSIVFDEGRAPLVELRVTVHVPDDATAIDRIDPRTGSRLLLDAGYRIDGAEHVERVADLRLDSRGVRRPDDTMELVATSHELLMQEWSPLAGSRTLSTTQAADATLAGIILWHDSTADVQVDAGLAVPWAEPGDDPVRIDATSDTWNVLTDVADRAGDLWVYCDALGVWRIRSRVKAAGAVVATVNVGENGTLLDSDSLLSRQDWANAVVVVHEWTDAAGTARTATGFAVVDSGPMRPALVGLKAITVRRSTPGTALAAKTAAGSLLRRAVTRGRTVNVRAIAAWWLRPADTVAVQLPTGDPLMLLASRVELGLTDGTMRINCRHPETFTITTGE